MQFFADMCVYSFVNACGPACAWAPALSGNGGVLGAGARWKSATLVMCAAATTVQDGAIFLAHCTTFPLTVDCAVEDHHTAATLLTHQVMDSQPCTPLQPQ